MKTSQLIVRIFGILLGACFIVVGILSASGVFFSYTISMYPSSNATYGADYYTDSAEYFYDITYNTGHTIGAIENLAEQIGVTIGLILIVTGLLIIIVFFDKIFSAPSKPQAIANIYRTTPQYTQAHQYVQPHQYTSSQQYAHPQPPAQSQYNPQDPFH